MSHNEDHSVLNDDDMFNISDFDNQRPFYELEPYVREFAPDYWPTMAKVLRGEDVSSKEFHNLTDALVEKLIPYYEPDYVISDPKMAHMHETIVAVGKQL